MSLIDRYVVNCSIEMLSKKPNIELFVNLSGLSLGDEDLLKYIKIRIHESGIEPCRIGFEITETSAVKDFVQAERWIHELKKMGCSFALDDFGTGFSSFAYLRFLPVDYLKIDGTYISNLDKDPAQRALVQAMNTVAQSLGKRTISEFVENEKILQILGELKIDFGQGYYLGEPVPIARI